MSIYEARKNPLGMSMMNKAALLLIFAVILWSIGAPTFLRHANAAQLSDVSDTLSNSNPGTTSVDTINFTATDSIQPTQTIKVQFDPNGSTFSEAYSGATTTDMSFNVGATNYSVVSSCTSGNQVAAVGNYNNGTDENLTLTLCNSAAAIATSSTVTIGIGTTTNRLISNPSTPGSYVIRIGGTMPNSGDTEVAILNNVTVTASVNTSFTFTVSGVATSTVVNGVTTTGSSTATALAFGTLDPTSSSTLAQTLSVSTNARNGFAVTVQENQPLTSSNGATIALFSNGATTSTPIAWVAPSNTLGQPNTYGHFGISSDDSDLPGAVNDFTGGKFAGNIDTPREVFANSGPADGTTQNDGLAHVAYKIQIGTLQPAGNDYTNTLTYVATPTF